MFRSGLLFPGQCWVSLSYCPRLPGFFSAWHQRGSAPVCMYQKDCALVVAALQIPPQRRSIPGVQSLSVSLNNPQNICCINLNISVAGRSDRWIGEVNVLYSRVGPHYFETIGTPLLLGRLITEQDTSASKRVADVDRAFANKFFAGENPIGKHFALSLAGHDKDYETVGRRTEHHVQKSVRSAKPYVSSFLFPRRSTTSQRATDD